MSLTTISLDVIDVAKPCPVDWNEMRGDERIRFCKHCSLHVYNLSAMNREQAQKLVADREGRMCVRFYRREDGTVTTQDCDGWWRVAKKRVNRWTSAAVALLLAALGTTRWSSASATSKSQPPIIQREPVALQGDVIMGKMKPPATQPVVVMGVIAPVLVPTSQPATATTQPAEPK